MVKQRKWFEVRSLVLKLITDENMKEGDKLPSDSELAAKASCSLQPVLRAMEDLERLGVVQRTAGGPSVVGATQPVLDYRDFSFSESARKRGHRVESRVIEKSRRLPLQGEDLNSELAIQEVLGLRRSDPFYVIARLRILDGTPRVIHRSYLNPSHFPPTFLADHEFAEESLIEVFHEHDYQMHTRNTTLCARLPAEQEKQLLGIGDEPILAAEQELLALPKDGSSLVVIEFLTACYVRWRYRITDRRDGSSEEHEGA